MDNFVLIVVGILGAVFAVATMWTIFGIGEDLKKIRRHLVGKNTDNDQ